jgi:membrane protease YdiL (CAAX protease family)
MLSVVKKLLDIVISPEKIRISIAPKRDKLILYSVFILVFIISLFLNPLFHSWLHISENGSTSIPYIDGVYILIILYASFIAPLLEELLFRLGLRFKGLQNIIWFVFMISFVVINIVNKYFPNILWLIKKAGH